MPFDIQAFSNVVIPFLEELYVVHNYKTTQAIRDIISSRSTTLEEAIKTLDLYSSEELVQKFISKHQDLIQEARDSLKPAASTKPKEDVVIDWDALYKHRFNDLKKKPVTDLETALSIAVSQFLEKEVVVSVDNITPEKSGRHTNAKIEITLR